MFKHILAPLDGSALAEAVLPHLIAHAKATGSQVTLLRVLDRAETVNQAPIDPVDWQLRKAEADNYLKNLSARLEDSLEKVSSVILEGKAAEMVIDYAHNSQVDLVMLSSHGQSGISGWNVSSVVQKIIMRVRTSIMIVRAYQAIEIDFNAYHYKRIVVPLDGSQRAEFVLPDVVGLARAHDAQVIAVHVVKQPEMPRRTPLSQDDIDLINQINERNRVEATRYLDELKGRIDTPIETRLLVSENVSNSLHSLVEDEHADLVVMSAHGYSGGTRWPYGSQVISFIVYGTTPLLVLQDLPSEQIDPLKVEALAQERGGR